MSSDKESMIRSLEQGRAKYAYDCALKGSKEKFSKKYKSYTRKIPVLIKTNGLGQTLAYLKSKKDDAYELLYNQVSNWLRKDAKVLLELKEGDDLVQKVVSLESPLYRAVTVEVLAFMNWLRRFADGLIEGEDENED